LCCFNKFVDNDSRRGNTAQALARWQHPVAPSEALDVLYRAMRPASYRRIRIAIEIVVLINLTVLFGRPLSKMDAVTASIFDDGRVNHRKHE